MLKQAVLSTQNAETVITLRTRDKVKSALRRRTIKLSRDSAGSRVRMLRSKRTTSLTFVFGLGMIALSVSEISAQAAPWHFFADGKCVAATKAQRGEVNHLVIGTSAGTTGCSFVVNDLKTGVVAIDCPNQATAEWNGIYVFASSKGTCQKNIRTFRLLKDRWFAFSPKSNTCVDAANVGGSNMSPWNVILQFPECKERLVDTDVLEINCQGAPEMRTNLYYATTTTGCEYLQQQLTSPK